MYAGKTDRCHPTTNVRAGWNIMHSDNHWLTENTMLKFVAVLASYFAAEHQRLKLPEATPGARIWDVFAAHRCESV